MALSPTQISKNKRFAAASVAAGRRYGDNGKGQLDWEPREVVGTLEPALVARLQNVMSSPLQVVEELKRIAMAEPDKFGPAADLVESQYRDPSRPHTPGTEIFRNAVLAATAAQGGRSEPDQVRALSRGADYPSEAAAAARYNDKRFDGALGPHEAQGGLTAADRAARPTSRYVVADDSTGESFEIEAPDDASPEELRSLAVAGQPRRDASATQPPVGAPGQPDLAAQSQPPIGAPGQSPSGAPGQSALAAQSQPALAAQGQPPVGSPSQLAPANPNQPFSAGPAAVRDAGMARYVVADDSTGESFEIEAPNDAGPEELRSLALAGPPRRDVSATQPPVGAPGQPAFAAQGQPPVGAPGQPAFAAQGQPPVGALSPANDGGRADAVYASGGLDSVYNLPGPDGATYRVQGPEGTTLEAAQKQLQSYFTSSQPDVPLASNLTPLPAAENPVDKFGLPIYPPAQPKVEELNRGLAGNVADTVVGFAAGIPKAAAALAGVVGMIPGVSFLADPLASALEDAGDYLDDNLTSDYQKAKDKELTAILKDGERKIPEGASTKEGLTIIAGELADQLGNLTTYGLENPGQIPRLLASVLPYMLAGGPASSGVIAGAKATTRVLANRGAATSLLSRGAGRVANMSARTAGAVGEGLVAGGATSRAIVNNLEEDGVTGYTADRLLGVPAGIATAGLGRLTSGALNKLGVNDADTLIGSLATGKRVDVLAGTEKLTRTGRNAARATRTAVASGGEFLEETTQSASEKAFENVGSGDPIAQGVGSESALGGLLGSQMGIGASMFRRGGAQPTSVEGSMDPEDQTSSDDLNAQMAADQEAREAAEVEAAALQGAVARTQRDLRNKHGDTFLTSKQYSDITLDAQVAEALDPTTELGDAFNDWRDEPANNVRSKDPKVLAEAAKKFLASAGTKEEKAQRAKAIKTSYLADMAEHGEFMEAQAARTPKEQADAVLAINGLLKIRADAIAKGDAAAVAELEASIEASRGDAVAVLPGEWRMAKWASDGLLPKTKADTPAPKTAKELRRQPGTGVNPKAPIPAPAGQVQPTEEAVADEKPATTPAPVPKKPAVESSRDKTKAFAVQTFGEKALDDPEIKRIIARKNISNKDGDGTLLAVRALDNLWIARNPPATPVETPAVAETAETDDAQFDLPLGLPSETPAVAETPVVAKGKAKGKVFKVEREGKKPVVFTPGSARHNAYAYAASKFGDDVNVMENDEVKAILMADDTNRKTNADAVKKRIDAVHLALNPPANLTEAIDRAVAAEAIETTNDVARANVKKAEAAFGPNWQLRHPSLVPLVNAKALFSTALDSALNEGPGPSNARAFLTALASETVQREFPASERGLFKVFTDALSTGTLESIIDLRKARGQTGEAGGFRPVDPARLARMAGIKNSKNISLFMERMPGHIAKALGITEAQVQEALAPTAALSSATDVPIEAPVSDFDSFSEGVRDAAAVAAQDAQEALERGEPVKTEAGSGTNNEAGTPTTLKKFEKAAALERARHVKLMQGAGVSQKDVDAFLERFDASVKEDFDRSQTERFSDGDTAQYAEDNAASLETRRTLTAPVTADLQPQLRDLWNNLRSEGNIEFDNLTDDAKSEFTIASAAVYVADPSGTGIGAEAATALQDLKDLQLQLESDAYVRTNQQPGRARLGGPDAAGGSSAVGNAGLGVDTNVEAGEVAGSGSGTPSEAPRNATVETKRKRVQVSKEALASLKPARAATGPDGKVIKGRLALKKSSGKRSEGSIATTKKALLNAATALFPDVRKGEQYSTGGEIVYKIGGANSRVQVFNTIDEALRVLGPMGMSRADLTNTQAVIDPVRGDRAYFIAENIPEGAETAVLLHEVGVHLGLELNLNSPQFDALTAAVRSWASAPEGSVENQVYRAVSARMAFAQLSQGAPLAASELVAYAVEEAALLGVEPEGNSKNVVAKFLQDVAQFFHNLFNDTTATKAWPFTAQDLVTLAHGAAYGTVQRHTTEVGVSPDENNDTVMRYYAGTDKGGQVLDGASVFGGDGPGTEIRDWGEGSSLGPFKSGILSLGLVSEDGEALVTVFYASEPYDVMRARGATEPSEYPILRISSSHLAVPSGRPTVEWVIRGPDAAVSQGPIPDWVQKHTTKAKAVDESDVWDRLEGFSPTDITNIFTEARRRQTRADGGLVPDVMFTRATGAAANMEDKELAKRDKLFGREVIERKYSRAPQPRQRSTGAAVPSSNTREWIRKNSGASGVLIFDNMLNVIKRPVDSLKPLHNYIDDVRKIMPAAKVWYKAMTDKEATRNEITREVEAVAVLSRGLTPSQLARTNDFIGTSTFYQQWGYDPKLVPGTVTTPNPIMEQAFNRLTQPEQNLVEAIFRYGHDMRLRKQAIATAMGVTGPFGGGSLTGPYAPLSRFGNYVTALRSSALVAQEAIAADTSKAPAVRRIAEKRVDKMKSDPKHYVVRFFPTEGEANQYRDAQAPNFGVAETFPRREFAGTRAPSGDVMEKLMAKLGVTSNSTLDPATKTLLRGMMQDIYMQQLDEEDARRSNSKRKNRAGYDPDMVKAFVTHGTSEAHFVAQMEHGAAVHAAMETAGKEAAANRSDPKVQDAFKAIQHHYNGMLTTTEGWGSQLSSRVMAVNTLYMLTSSVGYHMQNASQTMIAAGKLAGDFGGYVGAWNHLLNGYKVARQGVDGSIVKQAATVLTLGTVDFSNTLDINIKAFPVRYQALISKMDKAQLADVGLQAELGQFSKFNTGIKSVDNASEFASKMGHRLHQAARYVEAYNRIASAVAAYDMAEKNPQKVRRLYDMDTTEYALSVVQDTQGNFSRLDAPSLIKSLPRVMTQYRKYQIMMAWLYANGIKRATKGETPEIRWAAKRMLAYQLAQAGVVAGAVGLPGVNFVAGLVMAMAGGDDDEPKDLERWIKESLPEDDFLATMLSKGLPASLGLDASTKLSQATIFSPAPYVETSPGDGNWMRSAAQLVFGPTATHLNSIDRAADFSKRGNDFRMFETLMPKGIKSWMEAWRYTTEGYTAMNGNVAVRPDSFNIADALFTGLGLATTNVQSIKWTRGQQYEITEWFGDQTGRLKREYQAAASADERQAVRRQWRDLQDAKDRVRPFFGDSRKVLRRAPISGLIKSERALAKDEKKLQAQLSNIR